MGEFHYLYECDGNGVEKFVYYCLSCSCVLGVMKEPRPVGDMIEQFEGRCPSCGGTLEGSAECKIAPVAEDWSDVDSAPVGRRSTQRISFSRASTLLPFSLGFPKLDLLIQPLILGKVLMLTGSGASAVAELAALRAQLPAARGGMDSSVVFVDGGNCSDPYLLASFARQHGMDPRKALRRVVTSRAFTMYQMADLVSFHLAETVDDNASKLVVIADVLGTFAEPEVEWSEAKRTLASIKAGIDRVKGMETLVLCTLASPTKFDGLVTGWPDSLVRLSASESSVRAELVRGTPRFRSAYEFKMESLLRSGIERAVAR